MLVARIIGDCPHCESQRTYGNVFVSGDHVLRGCTRCTHSIRLPLPKIRKTILYLDQFFFSTTFQQRDPRFVEAAQRIEALSAQQLLVVPFSSVHEEEAHQWTGYAGQNRDDLMAFIEASARGHEFEPAYDVERDQIARAFKSYLANNPSTAPLVERDALRRDVHEWDGYVRFSVGHYRGDIEVIRQLKHRSVDGLVSLFADWRQSTNTFEQDVALELTDAAQGYLNAYLTYRLRLANGDFSAIIDAPIVSKVVESLFHYFPEQTPQAERWKHIGNFFRSSHFAAVPYQSLSAKIFAALKQSVKRGAYVNEQRARERLRGIFEDVKHIATYAPYCDAILVDKAMAALVRDPHVRLAEHYNVRVFSVENWDEFVAWLDSLADRMSQEHREGLALAYP